MSKLRFNNFWKQLTQAEKVVALAIVLTPVWWLWGWSYLLLLLAISIVIYEFYQPVKLAWSKPDFVVSGAIAFGIYDLISTYFYRSWHTIAINPRSLLWSVDAWIAPGIILWYIKSKQIRVRLSVVAGAVSILIIEMLLLWLLIYFVWHQGNYTPMRSLFGLLTGKGEQYIPGLGNSNYLMPYFPRDSSLPGLVRYVFFFHGPESLALVLALIAILALDIKNQLWSSLLLASTVFLLLLSGTRSVWLALPMVLVGRYLLTVGRSWGAAFVCASIALVSYITLVIPVITQRVFAVVTNILVTTGEFRGDSTAVRGEIYRRTLEGIVNANDVQFWFGHVVTGETVLPGYAPAMVGTHSFYLGNLLYQSGLVGTAIFVIFWIALIYWFYQLRKEQPICCLLILMLFSLVFCVMAWESTVMPIILICAVISKRKGSRETGVGGIN